MQTDSNRPIDTVEVQAPLRCFNDLDGSLQLRRTLSVKPAAHSRMLLAQLLSGCGDTALLDNPVVEFHN
nr:MAG TPA: hypothetical protein [Caudoviricetes sp.]